MSLVSSVVAVQGQEQTTVDPKPYGFDIPAGVLQLGSGQRVTTVDAAGRSVVAKVYLTIGDYQVLLFPDGKLAALPATKTRFTERPFVGESKTTLAKRMTERGPLAEFRTRTTDDYLFIYNTSDEFESVTRRILGRMLPALRGYAKNRNIATVAPEVPLVVVMFRTDEQFQTYQRMPRGVVAYYNTLTNQVVMFEQSRINETNPEIAKQQRLSTIAHEGVHQILHNIGIQQRLSRWPMWISEGMAEFLIRALANDVLEQLDAERGKALEALEVASKQYNYREHGGAPLLGIDGVCMICHGSSDARAIANALRAATTLESRQVNIQIVDDLATASGESAELTGGGRPS